MSRGPRTSSKRLYYTVGELSDMAGVSPKRMRGLLEANEIKLNKSGPAARRGVVFISTLAQALPELVDSIALRGGEDE